MKIEARFAYAYAFFLCRKRSYRFLGFRRERGGFVRVNARREIHIVVLFRKSGGFERRIYVETRIDNRPDASLAVIFYYSGNFPAVFIVR